MTWISVKDGLPENQGLFVLRLDDEPMCIGSNRKWKINYETGTLENIDEYRFFAYTHSRNQVPICEDITHKVTHYLEIPELLEKPE